MLAESQREIIEEKFNCFVCDFIIKKEKPYFCYICQKNFHIDCLEKWNNQKLSQNQVLNCPNCRNELPLNKWKQKINFEDERLMAGVLMNKMNQIKLDNNLNNNLNKINEKKLEELSAEINQLKNENKEEINNLKNDNIKQKHTIEGYNKYVNDSSLFFKNMLYKINEIVSMIKLDSNYKLLDLISELSSNNNIPQISNISSVMNEEFDIIYKYIKKIKDQEEIQKRNEELFILIHEYQNEINLIYSTNNEGIQFIF